jgi:hypothetical protein
MISTSSQASRPPLAVENDNDLLRSQIKTMKIKSGSKTGSLAALVKSKEVKILRSNGPHSRSI